MSDDTDKLVKVIREVAHQIDSVAFAIIVLSVCLLIHGCMTG